MSLTDIQNNIIPVFCAYEVHDEYGRNKTLMSIHRTKQEAELAAVRKGYYGGPGDVQMKHAIEDGLDLYLLVGFAPSCFADVTAQREAARKVKLDAIKAKLTKEELEILMGDTQ
jgi:hypothetical protein